jgi:ubiquinone/menaquinone biosynthesis C-methylase UbiE
MSQDVREIFGRRAAYYTASANHKDEAVLGRLVELAKPRPDGAVLDVATGTGHAAFALATRARYVAAVDVTPEMIAEGRKLQDERKAGNVLFGLADAHNLPFPGETFDIVNCRLAAHHFQDIGRALREMKRVLKTGGRLVINDRSVPEDAFAAETLNRLDVLHDRSHVREYRPSEWVRMLEDGAFAVEVLETYTRHRPLSSFTAKADPGDRDEIVRIVAGLTASQRAAMNVATMNCETYIDHWFVIAAAVKGDGGKR